MGLLRHSFTFEVQVKREHDAFTRVQLHAGVLGRRSVRVEIDVIVVELECRRVGLGQLLVDHERHVLE